MMRNCYSVSRSPIGENNESVSRNWNVFRHGIVAELTSAAEDFAKIKLVQSEVKS